MHKIRRSIVEQTTLIKDVKRSIDSFRLKVRGTKIKIVKKVAQNRRDSVLCTSQTGILSILSAEKVSFKIRGISVFARLMQAMQQPRSETMVQYAANGRYFLPPKARSAKSS